MSDIVERLKARAAWWDKLHDYVVAKRDEARGTEWFGRFNAMAHSVRGRVPVEDEAADEITRLRAEVERLQEALTPSGATKAAYIGEFHFTDSYIGEDGNDVVRKVAVPWTSVKEIMVAIRARAALTAQEKTDG